MRVIKNCPTCGAEVSYISSPFNPPVKCPNGHHVSDPLRDMNMSVTFGNGKKEAEGDADKANSGELWFYRKMEIRIPLFSTNNEPIPVNPPLGGDSVFEPPKESE